MKSVYIAAIIGVFAVSAVTANNCNCNPTDNECLRDCVNNTNSCINECQGNTECYQRCIDGHWPGVDSQYNQPSATWNYPSSTWMSSNWDATPTSQWSSQWSGSSQWSAGPTQSSQWGAPSSSWASGSSWAPGYTNTMIIPSNSPMPSNSGASPAQISKAVLGLGLACAAYALQ